MNPKKLFLQRFFLGWILLFPRWGTAQNYEIKSPDNELLLTVSIQDSGLYYQLRYLQDTLLRSSQLGVVFAAADTLRQFVCVSVDSGRVDEDWFPLWGVKSRIRNNYRFLRLTLQAKSGSRHMEMDVRAYDDGVAFRYVFPDSIVGAELLSELTAFNFNKDARCWWSWADYNTLEKTYQVGRVSAVSHFAAPFTAQTDSGVCVSILEAAIDDYTTMTLKKSELDSLSLVVNLVPWSDGVAVKSDGPFHSPWRVIQVAPDPAGLLSSTLLWNLNSPPQGDFSWVKPIRYVGIWWEMHLGLSTWKKDGGRHGATTTNAKRYIDFAAEHGIEGVLVEGWNTGWERWGEKDAFDFTTPFSDFDLEDIASYANTRNVKLIGHHETGGDIMAYESRMDSAFALYRKLGIDYVKTGYAGPVNPSTESHHGQYMVRHFNRVMKTAARYQLMLDVHEPVIPTGWGRTYPNLMTFEGVRGMEWNAWSSGNPPSHTCTLPFTRGLAGPMDYTPGIFDVLCDAFSSKRVKWNGEDIGKSAVHSTLSNQLALLVINYSPMQMAADLPDNYEGHPAFRFIEALPTTWDEMKVLSASIGEYVVIARRRGNDWYIAAITDEHSRELTLKLDFLEAGKRYRVEACLDTPLSHFEQQPESYSIQTGVVQPTDEFQCWMAPGGGAMIILRPY